MKWLRRQRWRFQLARELLERYEYDEEHRIGAAEAMRRIEAAGYLGRATIKSGTAQWRAAVEARADQYPSG